MQSSQQQINPAAIRSKLLLLRSAADSAAQAGMAATHALNHVYAACRKAQQDADHLSDRLRFLHPQQHADAHRAYCGDLERAKALHSALSAEIEPAKERARRAADDCLAKQALANGASQIAQKFGIKEL